MIKQKLILIIVVALVLAGCATAENDLEGARNLNTIKSYKEFLIKHPENELTLIAEDSIRNLKWQSAQQIDTIVSYNEFLQKYPQGEFAVKAKRRIEGLAWEKAQSLNSIEAYEKFLRGYPQNEFTREGKLRIEALAWENAQSLKTIEAYEEFLRRNPQSELKQEAIKIIVADVKVIRLIIGQDIVEVVDKSGKKSQLTRHKTRGYYKDYTLEQIYNPIEEYVRKVFKYTAIEVVGADATTYDATLTIRVKGEAIGAGYTSSPGSLLNPKISYSGAKVSGDMSFEVSGFSLKKENILGEVSPVKTIYPTLSGPYLSPSEFPLRLALSKEGSFLEELVRITGEMFGIKAITKALLDKDGDLGVRKAAANALGRIGDRKAVDPLIETLVMDGGYFVDPLRQAAANALGMIGAVDLLIKVIMDKDGNGRKAAANALGRIGDRKAIEPLIEALLEKDGHVQIAAAYALGRIGDRKAVDPLIEALLEKNGNVRKAAANALGMIGDRKAIEPLIKMQKDYRYTMKVREAARKAIYSISAEGL